MDVAGYFKKLEEGRLGSNVIHQVPHNDVRQQVHGQRQPGADARRAEEDGELVDQGMQDGAWGLSTGLIYNPGTYAAPTRSSRWRRWSAGHGGFYASHIRDEGAGVLSAIERR